MDACQEKGELALVFQASKRQFGQHIMGKTINGNQKVIIGFPKKLFKGILQDSFSYSDTLMSSLFTEKKVGNVIHA